MLDHADKFLGLPSFDKFPQLTTGFLERSFKKNALSETSCSKRLSLCWSREQSLLPVGYLKIRDSECIGLNRNLTVTVRAGKTVTSSGNEGLSGDSIKIREFWTKFSTDQQSWKLPKDSKEKHQENTADIKEAVSCTTFNILAPIYKRLQEKEDIRESEFKNLWLNRNIEIADILSSCGSSIICLQEFWLDNPELVRLYEEKLGNHGYEIHACPRTNNRGDGLLTAIKSSILEVIDCQKLLFNDCGDRVAQVLRLRLRAQSSKENEANEFLVVNTHLLFPHNSDSSNIRLRQVHKILDYLGEYKQRNGLKNMPIILCGDWNGSKKGQVFKFLRSQGFVSTYDMAREYSDADHNRWVSHRNHRGNICGVDFIWLLNPDPEPCQSLDVNWKAAVFRSIRDKIEAAGLGLKDAFRKFQGATKQGKEGKLELTFGEFQAAMDGLGVTGRNSLCLSREEVEELLQAADTNRNGVIEYAEFERAFCEENMEGQCPNFGRPGCGFRGGVQESPAATCLKWNQEREDRWQLSNGAQSAESPAFRLSVEDAFLFPPEMESGYWPESYSLSDHAPLTAVLLPQLSASPETKDEGQG